MKKKRCIICGCIMYDSSESVICECCKDELDECNPYTQWCREEDAE